MPPVPLEPCSHTTSPSSRWSSSWVALVPFVQQNFVKSLLVQWFPSYIGATCKMPRDSRVLLSHFICQHSCTFSFTLLTRKSETIFGQIHRVYVLRQYAACCSFYGSGQQPCRTYFKSMVCALYMGSDAGGRGHWRRELPYCDGGGGYCSFQTVFSWLSGADLLFRHLAFFQQK